MVLSIPIFGLAGLLVFRTVTQRSIAKNARISSPDGIESLEGVSIGGVTQWLLIRGENRNNPVLLWLHGGPGTANMALAPKRDASLLEHFTVVQWDQRGAGKSFGGVPETSLTVDRFVSDIREVVLHLKQRLGVETVYLVGHSWGSMIGALAASRYPELFEAFVGIGQSVSPKGDSITYEWLTKKASQSKNEEAQRALQELGPPPWSSFGDARVVARWVAHFGGAAREFNVTDLYLDMAVSPVYSLGDLIRFIRGLGFTQSTMFANGELGSVDLMRDAPRIDVPVFFFHGRHDYTTPGELVQEYFQALEAPRGKALIWFERSAHVPQWEEPERYVRELLRVRGEVEGR